MATFFIDEEHTFDFLYSTSIDNKSEFFYLISYVPNIIMDTVPVTGDILLVCRKLRNAGISVCIQSLIITKRKDMTKDKYCYSLSMIDDSKNRQVYFEYDVIHNTTTITCPGDTYESAAEVVINMEKWLEDHYSCSLKNILMVIGEAIPEDRQINSGLFIETDLESKVYYKALK